MKFYIKTAAFIALAMTVGISYAASPEKPRRKHHKTVHVPVYDTIRMVVTDTVRIVPKASPRIDTLRLEQTPEEIDSLVEAWSVMQTQAGDESFFGQYSEELESETALPHDPLYYSRP